MNLPDDSEFVLIREDSPTFRAGLDDFWGGASQSSTYPSVVPLRRSGNASATQWPRQRLSKEWHLFVRDQLNKHNTQAVNIIYKVEAGWINGQDQVDQWKLDLLEEYQMPKPEFITSSGNIARILERNSVGVRLDTFNINDPAPIDPLVSFDTAATRIVHFMAGHKDGYYVNISSGSTDGLAYDTYFPLIAPGEAWVHFKDNFTDNRIEFLPSLPRTVKTNASLAVRSEPTVFETNVIEFLAPGKTVTVTQYYPSATGVWGKTVNGWIALQYLPYTGQSNANYFTDWKLSGIPALRPKHLFL